MVKDVRQLYAAAIRARNHLAVIIYDQTKAYMSRVARVEPYAAEVIAFGRESLGSASSLPPGLPNHYFHYSVYGVLALC